MPHRRAGRTQIRAICSHRLTTGLLRDGTLSPFAAAVGRCAHRDDAATHLYQLHDVDDDHHHHHHDPPRSIEAGSGVVEVPVEVTAEGGFLVVPENRTAPDTEQLRLAVMKILTPDGAARPDPIVYLDGGPGGPGIHPLELGAWSGVARVSQRDVVLFSQRGTVFNDPDLSCDDLNILLVESVEDCRARLVEQGRDLAAYTSASSAPDLAELRTALGYEEWNLLGTDCSAGVPATRHATTGTQICRSSSRASSPPSTRRRRSSSWSTR